MALSSDLPVRERSRDFAARLAETSEALERLSAESQAGLRQFSLERMTGYGIDYADAVELRAGVLAGGDWQTVAADLARRALADAERQDPPASETSKSLLHYRASALLRMSQALMLADSAMRRAIVGQAVEEYAKAVALGLNRRHVHIETEDGPMAAWYIRAQTKAPVGSVVVIGGVEGWAMDFDVMGDALAQRGMNALMLDAPGQGETRILHGHYLSPRWRTSFTKAIDFIEGQGAGVPIGIVGNSMGGGMALAVANGDRRITACVNNGGIIKPSLARMAGETFFAKMIAFCGVEDPDEAAAIWDTVEPVKPGANTDYSLLVLQGGEDPLVSDAHARTFMEMTPARDKQMERFSDGIHCIYNHAQDRDILLSDWMHARLANLPFRDPA